MGGVLGFLIFIFTGWIFLKLISSIGSPKEKNYSKSTPSNTDQAKFYYSQASVCSKNKEYRQAIYYYDLAISYDKSSTYYNNRGFAKSELNDLTGAIDDYSTAIKLSPNESIYFNNRGMAYHAKGDDILACSDWKKAADLGHSTAKEMLAKYCNNGLGETTQNEYLKYQEIIGKDLNSTKWRLTCSHKDVEDSDIEFHPNGVLLDSKHPEDKTRWTISNSIISLIYGNGFCTYNGTISGNIYSGNANNKSGQKWTFRAELINKSENHSLILPSYQQKKVQPSNKVKIVDNLSSSIIKRTNWTDFNKILKENNISTLYHFTAKVNIQSIKEHGALYSWSYCQNNNIDIPQAGGDELSRSLDRRHGFEDYVRLSFTRNHPMMYFAQTRGRIGNSVVLEIDPEVIFWKSTKFANKNAARNDVNIGSTLEDLKKIRFNIVKQHNHLDLAEEDKPYYQAEVLVLQKIPIEFITNINEFR
jgi:tetratricopeptide (TPR) repeat protein